MTRLALVSTADNSIISAPLPEGGWVDLPNGARVSPALAGWQGDADHPYRLLAITDFTVPDGKQIAGAATYAVNGDTVTETFPVEDIPAPPDLTPAEKLANAGLTVADLKSLLGLS
jgi:hypothetical protein